MLVMQSTVVADEVDCTNAGVASTKPRRVGRLVAGLAALCCAALLATGGAGTAGWSLVRLSQETAGQAQAAVVFSPLGRTGPAEEYTQAEAVHAMQPTHGSGPADEYQEH